MIQAALDVQEDKNQMVVAAFYEALQANDFAVVQGLLAPDLEWWFHGPPAHQHLMRLLTGTLPAGESFTFLPSSIVVFGSIVVAEGYNTQHAVSWVHAWTIDDNGVIIQVREYLNTAVIVTRFGSTHEAAAMVDDASSQVAPQSTGNYCQSVWQSKLSDHNSLPGLVLAL